MEEKQNLTVEGYHFRTEEDAKLARVEAQKVAYIEKRINYSKPASVLAIYKKALEEKTFHTPIGLSYLEDLYDFLNKSDVIEEEIPPIPLDTFFSRTMREQTSPARKRIKTVKKRNTLKEKYRISVMFNIILLLLVAAMFYIALNGTTPNMLNYEQTLVNKYAEWEQELTERENLIRQKELELNIQE